MLQHEAQAFGDLLAQVPFCDVGPFLALTDGVEAQRRPGEADGRGDQREGRGDQLHQVAADARPAELGDGADHLQCGVALHELLAADQVRQVALVRDIEKDGEDAQDHGYSVQQVDRQHVEPPGQRHAGQRQRASPVADDHHVAPAQPIDDGPGRQTDHREGEGLADGQQAHLEWRGVDGAHRHEGKGQHQHLSAHLARGVGEEKGSEIMVTEDTHGQQRRRLIENCQSVRVGFAMAGTNRRPATQEEARALASSIRLRILRQCLDNALTNKEIAARLQANPATVLHHVRKLVKTGFLAAEPTRPGPRGSTEIPYRATGKSWEMDIRDAGVTGGRAAMIDAFLEEIRLGDPEDAHLTRMGLRLSEEDKAELLGRLQEIFAEFKERGGTPGGVPYSLFLALHQDHSR